MRLIRVIAPFLLSLVPLTLGAMCIVIGLTAIPREIPYIFIPLGVLFIIGAIAICFMNYGKSKGPVRTAARIELQHQLYTGAQLPEDFNLDLPDAWSVVDDYPRINWDTLGAHIENQLPEELWDAADVEVVNQWLHRLVQALEGDYQVYCNGRNALVTARPPNEASMLLNFCRDTEAQVLEMFRLPGDHLSHHPRVAMLFHDGATYYQYVACYYPEEKSFAPSGGVFLPREYPHIAMPDGADWQVTGTLLHELTHLCLSSMALPLWLEEGMIRVMERKLGRFGTDAAMDEKEVRKHHRLWTPRTIEQFWSGESFLKPDPWQGLSYSLAEVLVNILLAEGRSQFPVFVESASYEDVGESAARNAFGFGVGDALAVFLGDGEWTPENRAEVANEPSV